LDFLYFCQELEKRHHPAPGGSEAKRETRGPGERTGGGEKRKVTLCNKPGEWQRFWDGGGGTIPGDSPVGGDELQEIKERKKGFAEAACQKTFNKNGMTRKIRSIQKWQGLEGKAQRRSGGKGYEGGLGRGKPWNHMLKREQRENERWKGSATHRAQARRKGGEDREEAHESVFQTI